VGEKIFPTDLDESAAPPQDKGVDESRCYLANLANKAATRECLHSVHTSRPFLCAMDSQFEPLCPT
jgi:hypothetical protein